MARRMLPLHGEHGQPRQSEVSVTDYVDRSATGCSRTVDTSFEVTLWIPFVQDVRHDD